MTTFIIAKFLYVLALICSAATGYLAYEGRMEEAKLVALGGLMILAASWTVY